MLFLTFHGPERFRTAGAPRGAARRGTSNPRRDQEPATRIRMAASAARSPAVVTVPLIALAIPSVFIGALTVGPVLFGGCFGEFDLRAAEATT